MRLKFLYNYFHTIKNTVSALQFYDIWRHGWGRHGKQMLRVVFYVILGKFAWHWRLKFGDNAQAKSTCSCTLVTNDNTKFEESDDKLELWFNGKKELQRCHFSGHFLISGNVWVILGIWFIFSLFLFMVFPQK